MMRMMMKDKVFLKQGKRIPILDEICNIVIFGNQSNPKLEKFNGEGDPKFHIKDIEYTI